jgi:predicted SnoaL-like aldol condensation-catalyzing enzyme
MLHGRRTIAALVPALLLCAVLLPSAFDAAVASDKVVPKNAAEATAIGLLDTAFNQRKVAEAFQRYVGPYYRQHNPTMPDGIDAILTTFPKWLAATPGLRYDIKRVISDGNLVVVHSHVTLNVTDRGMAVVDIFRLENGKIVEHWDVSQPVPEKSPNANTMF